METQHPPDPDIVAPHRVAIDEAFDLVIDGLTRNLAMCQQVRDVGRRRSAAEYIIGALDELAPELAALRAITRRM